MKNLVIIFAFVSILLLLVGCKNDIRNEYIGDWQFIVEMQKVNADSIGQFWQDTVYYNGRISKSNNDKGMEIQYTKEHSVSLFIDEFGGLYGFSTSYCNGKFDNENEIICI